MPLGVLEWGVYAAEADICARGAMLVMCLFTF